MARRRSIASARDVERGVDTDGDVRTVHVVVDRGRDADDREPAVVERVRTSKGPVSANDDEHVEPFPNQSVQGLLLPRIGRKLRSASAAQKSAGGLDDAADVPGAEPHKAAGHQPFEAVTHARDLEPSFDRGAYDGANRGVHARCVSAAREHGDSTHGVTAKWVDHDSGRKGYLGTKSVSIDCVHARVQSVPDVTGAPRT